MATCNALDKSFMFWGLRSMRMLFVLMAIGGPLGYMHPWLFSYSMLERAWFPAVLFRMCCSCEGNV